MKKKWGKSMAAKEGKKVASVKHEIGTCESGKKKEREGISRSLKNGIKRKKRELG
jgi:hypothetical protein